MRSRRAPLPRWKRATGSAGRLPAPLASEEVVRRCRLQHALEFVRLAGLRQPCGIVEHVERGPFGGAEKRAAAAPLPVQPAREAGDGESVTKVERLGT